MLAIQRRPANQQFSRPTIILQPPSCHTCPDTLSNADASFTSVLSPGLTHIWARCSAPSARVFIDLRRCTRWICITSSAHDQDPRHKKTPTLLHHLMAESHAQLTRPQVPGASSGTSNGSLRRYSIPVLICRLGAYLSGSPHSVLLPSKLTSS